LKQYKPWFDGEFKIIRSIQDVKGVEFKEQRAGTSERKTNELETNSNKNIRDLVSTHKCT
jgi:hypothetical protein